VLVNPFDKVRRGKAIAEVGNWERRCSGDFHTVPSDSTPQGQGALGQGFGDDIIR